MSRVEEALSRARGKVRIVSGSQSRNGDLTVFAREEPVDPGVVVYPSEEQSEERPKTESVAKPSVVPPAAPPARACHRAAVVPVTEPGMFAQPVCRFSEAVKGKVVISRDTSPLSVEQYRRLAATLHGSACDSRPADGDGLERPASRWQDADDHEPRADAQRIVQACVCCSSMQISGGRRFTRSSASTNGVGWPRVSAIRRDRQSAGHRSLADPDGADGGDARPSVRWLR